MTTYRFAGQVIDLATNLGLPVARVEAFDAEGLVPDLVAFTMTDLRGGFTISLDGAYLAQLFGARPPAVTFRVFTIVNDIAKRIASRLFTWNFSTENTTGRIDADSKDILDSVSEESRPTDSVIRGALLTATGEVLAATSVHAFTVSVMGDEDKLAEGEIEAGTGQYIVRYRTWKSSDVGGQHTVLVRASDDTGEVAASAPICHPPATLGLDLVQGGVLRGVAEFDALQRRMEGHLQLDYFEELASKGDLTDEHLEKLACASGADPEHIAAYAAASQVASSTGAPVRAHYALAREGLPTTSAELLRASPRDIRRALEAAVAKNVLPSMDTGDVDNVMAQLRAAAVDLAFERPTGTAGCLGDVVKSVLGTERARPFLDLYLSHDDTVASFWFGLPAQMQSISQEEIPELQFALQVGAVTRFNTALVDRLREVAHNNSDKLRFLASFDETTWAAVGDHREARWNDDLPRSPRSAGGGGEVDGCGDRRGAQGMPTRRRDRDHPRARSPATRCSGAWWVPLRSRRAASPWTCAGRPDAVVAAPGLHAGGSCRLRWPPARRGAGAGRRGSRRRRRWGIRSATRRRACWS
jgi:hypothetical protein